MRLPRWTPGKEILARDLNLLAESIERGGISHVQGGRLRGGGGGYTLTIDEARSGGGSSSSGDDQPLDLFISANDTGTALFADVVPGKLSGTVPDNLFNSFSVPLTGVVYFKLHATTNGAQVTGCSIVINATVPAVQTPVRGALPAAFDALIGLVKDGLWYRVIGGGSPIAESMLLYRTDKASPEPGEAPFDEWYAWRI